MADRYRSQRCTVLALAVFLVVTCAGHGWSQEGENAGSAKKDQEKGAAEAKEFDPGIYKERFEKFRTEPKQMKKNNHAEIRGGLDWLVRHQHADGHWGSVGFRKQCKADNPCKCSLQLGKHPPGYPGRDVGVTGLALLAFLGFGHTPEQGEVPEYRDAVKRAAAWLVSQRVERKTPDSKALIFKTTKNPEMGHYDHALATWALAEYLFLSQDRSCAAVLKEAVDYILRSQNPGYGWQYTFLSARNDTSVTGLMYLALKAAELCVAAGLLDIETSRIEKSLGDAMAWIHSSTARNGRTGYRSPGDPGSTLLKAYGKEYPFSRDPNEMTALSLLCRLWDGQKKVRVSKSKEKASKVVLNPVGKAFEILLAEPPLWRTAAGKTKSKVNMYYWFFASQAIRQGKAKEWKDWNKALRTALEPNQREKGCAQGSWDPIGEWGIVGGRVYSTALSVMALQGAYRYTKFPKKSTKKKKKK